jgi:hypothetical protein
MTTPTLSTGFTLDERRTLRSTSRTRARTLMALDSGDGGEVRDAVESEPVPPDHAVREWIRDGGGGLLWRRRFPHERVLLLAP